MLSKGMSQGANLESGNKPEDSKVSSGAVERMSESYKDDAEKFGHSGQWSKETGTGFDVDDDVALTFPQRLMEILDNEELSNVISWLAHGRGFVIYRKKSFEEKVLPRYFHKQSKFSSFTRKLNRWGFSRVTRGPEAGAYFHALFQRNKHRMVLQMACQSKKSLKLAQDTSSATLPALSSPVYQPTKSLESLRLPIASPLAEKKLVESILLRQVSYPSSPAGLVMPSLLSFEKADFRIAEIQLQQQQQLILQQELYLHQRAALMRQQNTVTNAALLQLAGGRSLLPHEASLVQASSYARLGLMRPSWNDLSRKF